MNMKRTIYISLILAAVTVSVSCARDVNESDTDISKRIFNAWMIESGYQDIKPTDVGIYIIDDTPGSGATVDDSMYFFVKQIRTTMDGSISAHNYEDLAKQLGTWTVQSRFTPTVWYSASMGIGLRDMVIGADITDNKGTGGMRVGGHRIAIIPPWVIDPDSGEEVVSESAVYIYDLTITDCTDDIIAYQIDSLERFKSHYPGGILKNIDSTYYGLYVKTYPTTVEENDTITEGSSISLWYIGKYLDGTVFDTNIKDTAKFYRIYNSSSTYSALSFTFYKDSANVVDNNSTVKGFTLAVREMKNYGDTCRTFFTSNWGYGSSGSGNIPGYEPLYFDIWIKDE